MNNMFFEKEYLITKICLYLNIKDILTFSACSHLIKDKLNPLFNHAINIIFNCEVSKKFFEMEEDYEMENIEKNIRKNIFDNNWKISINWKLFLSQTTRHFSIYPYKAISKHFLDSFKIHMYLMDIREENCHLDYDYSTIHQMTCYDKRKREIFKYNYYDKYINDNYLNNGRKNSDVKILKEGLPFENELKNFKNVYSDFLSSNEYKNVIELAIRYDFKKLSKIESKENNLKKNKITYFILWANKSFLLYCEDILENVKKYKDSDVKTFLEKYNTKYSNYENSSLLIDRHFQNINIIINYLNKYVLKQNINDKFSLYEMARIIFKNNVLDILQKDINDKILLLYDIALNNIINNIKEKIEVDEKKSNDINELADYSKTFSDCDMVIDETIEYIQKACEKNEKDIFENVVNNMVDMHINKYNGNAINHSEIILGKEYEKLENNLVNITIKVMQNKINKGENSFFDMFEILVKLLKTGNSGYVHDNSLKFINRTKKRIFNESLKYIFNLVYPKMLEDFNGRLKQNSNGRVLYISNSEKVKNNFSVDLSEFSNGQKRKIEKSVEDELKKLKACLYEQSINGYDVENTTRLVDDYLENNGIDFVLLMKKILYFYAKENTLYEEKDKKVYSILSKRNKINSPLSDLIKV